METRERGAPREFGLRMSLSRPPIDPASISLASIFPARIGRGSTLATATACRRFMTTRLALGAAGLACLPPLLALRGSPSPLDTLLALCLAAPLVAAALVSRTGRLEPGYGVAAAGTAGLVACALSGLGPAAWPVLMLLALDPIGALGAGTRRGAVACLLGSTLALAGTALVATLDGSLQGGMVQAQVALAFLVIGALANVTPAGLAPHLLGLRDAGSADRDALEHDIVDAIGDLLTWHALTGEVLRVEGAALRLTGLEPDALVGSGLFERVHVSDRPAYLKALDDAGAGPDPVSAEFRLHVTTSSPEAGHAVSVMWVEMRAHRVAATSASAACVVAFTRDASASRRHAAELDLARREAEQANELKGRFLANVSHELRTPLNAIIGFSELMTVDHPFVLTEERRREYASIINTSGHHLLDIVNTLLDMSKIETGNFDFAPESLALRELAHGCCDLIHIKAEQGGVRLVREVAHDMPEIVGDRRACRQILINLLSNAVKFTPDGGRVTLSVRIDGEDVVLAVADTGIGIRAADLPRLGDPFFQAGEVHKRVHEGTGLGLSVVRGLVGLHGGTMSIESGIGAGTTVTVRIPAFASADRERGKPAVVATASRDRDPARIVSAPASGDGARHEEPVGETRRMSA